MKKSLALVLALVMVLGSFSFVSAAPDFADVMGTKYEEAVSRLELLNVLKGYPDGTFKPEGSITRAEFAAVAVRVKGLAAVAEAAKGLPSGFSDVPAGHWAAGYVGVAGSTGIVRGIGGGLFAPNAPVKYEEAVTMLVRALGYEQDALSKGGYPYGYLIVAKEIDLLDDVIGTLGVPASRGVVAQLTDNALEIPMMIQVGFGADTKWVVSGTQDTKEVYLLDQMGFDTVTGRLSVKSEKDLEVVVDGKTLDVAKGFDFFLYEGVEVKVWYKSSKAIFMTMEETVKFDAVSYDESEDELTLVLEDEEYDVVTTDLWLDGVKKTTDFAADYAKVVFNDDDEVVFVKGYTFDYFLVVEEVDDEIVISYDDEELDLDDFTIVKNGKTVSAEEVEEDGLLFVNDKEEFALVYNVSKSGLITRVYTDSFRFDGKTYDFMDQYQMFLDGGKIAALTMNDVFDLYDDKQEVEVFFDTEGEVALIIGDLEGVASSEFFAILTDDVVQYSGRKGAMLALDILDQNGKEIAYDLVLADITTNLDYVVDGGVDGEGTAIRVFIEDDEVVEVEKLLLTSALDEFELDDTYLEGARLLSSTILFMDDYETVATIANAKFTDVAAGAKAFIEKGKVLAIFEVADADEEDTKYTNYTGLVTEVRKLRSTVWEFTIEVEGVEKEFLTLEKYDVSDAGVKVNDIVTVKVGNTTGKIADKAGLPDIKVETLRTVTVNDKMTAAKTFKFEGTTYALTAKGIVYDTTFDQIAFRELVEGSTVYVLIDAESADYAYVSYILQSWTAPAGE